MEADALLAAQRAKEDADLKRRRELLRARRKNKKNAELEQKRLEEKINDMAKDEEEEMKADEKELRDLYADTGLGDDLAEESVDSKTNKKKEDRKKKRERLLAMLNERLADNDIAKYANLLAK